MVTITSLGYQTKAQYQHEVTLSDNKPVQIVIEFVNDKFYKVHLPWTGTYTREIWQAFAVIESVIKRHEQRIDKEAQAIRAVLP